jgi:hypothetical protein
MEQTVVALPVGKLQPDRTDSLSWFGMTFAKKSTARHATVFHHPGLEKGSNELEQGLVGPVDEGTPQGGSPRSAKIHRTTSATAARAHSRFAFAA